MAVSFSPGPGGPGRGRGGEGGAGRDEAKRGTCREGRVATPSGEGSRRVRRRRCASLETCGGPEGHSGAPRGQPPRARRGQRSEHSFRRRLAECGARVASERHCPGSLPRRRSPGSLASAARDPPGPRGAGHRSLPLAARSRLGSSARFSIAGLRFVFFSERLRDVGVGVWGIRAPAPRASPGGMWGRAGGARAGTPGKGFASAHPGIAPGLWTEAVPPGAAMGRGLRGGQLPVRGRWRAELKFIVAGETEKGRELRVADALGLAWTGLLPEEEPA